MIFLWKKGDSHTNTLNNLNYLTALPRYLPVELCDRPLHPLMSNNLSSAAAHSGMVLLLRLFVLFPRHCLKEKKQWLTRKLSLLAKERICPLNNSIFPENIFIQEGKWRYGKWLNMKCVREVRKVCLPKNFSCTSYPVLYIISVLASSKVMEQPLHWWKMWF